MVKVYVLNSLVTPLPQNVKDGLFYVRKVSPKEFKRKFWEMIYEGHTVVSAVGHSATAEFLSELLGYPIEMRRRAIHYARGDIGFVVKLNGRKLSSDPTRQLREIRDQFEAKKVSFYIVERLL